ncbi:MAG: complex I NDUFA9 subunit family protein [Micavibrio aeruginosavorus]|uniref:Complex I NDUFA9 subunit family protein n=1 Tax=Micavibrio aeruginosavorus TaxID=349221 RepID=A0A2W4ZLH9_9BACT|nr:MAG: complex I NDUFA9 subunit family protein [Micavibrio aeruginosavorus]
MTTYIYKQACVFGGTGFIGRQVVRELAKKGYIVKVASRAPASAYFLKTAGNVGQIVPVFCDYSDSDVRKAVRGCEVVVNCIGILAEKSKAAFTKIHTEVPRSIAKACREEKVSRFIHISALGCDQAHSRYAKSKHNGEKAVLENFQSATILRPSVVFGPEDNFFNMFARLSVVMPFLPLIGGGETKLQPVYVGDVADAVMAAIENPASAGEIYELGGPDVLSFRDIYQTLFEHTARPRLLVNLPWGIAKLQGSLLSMLPGPLLTADQVETLKTDNVIQPGMPELHDLGIAPTSMASILPSYLSRYKPGGRFGDKKRA